MAAVGPGFIDLDRGMPFPGESAPVLVVSAACCFCCAANILNADMPSSCNLHLVTALPGCAWTDLHVPTQPACS